MPVRSAELEVGVCERLAPDAYVLFVASDERPLQGLAGLVDWRLAGGLSRLVQAGAIEGARGEKTLASPDGTVRALVFGLGEGARVTPEGLDELSRAAAEAIDRARWDLVLVGIPEAPSQARDVLRRQLYATKADVVLVAAPFETLLVPARPAPAQASSPPPAPPARRSGLSRP